jgi:hypothetical protein
MRSTNTTGAGALRFSSFRPVCFVNAAKIVSPPFVSINRCGTHSGLTGPTPA